VMNDNEELVKIHLDLPDNELTSGESLWAKPLGSDLYEIRNVPFFAYDLHYYDVVRAVTEKPELKPSIVEVVKRSGHKTLRVVFYEKSEEIKRQVLNKLNEMKAYHEAYNDTLYSVDVEPEGDYQQVCDYLWSQEQAGILEYETGTS